MPEDRKVSELTEERLREIIKEALNDHFTTVGVDVKEPLAMQRDMAHLRAWRQNMEKITSKSVLTVVAVAVAGLCALLWTTLTHTPPK